MKNHEIVISSIALVLTVFVTAGASFGLIAYDHYLTETNTSSSFASASESAPSFPDYEPIVKSGSIILFRDFIMSVPITPENIQKYSHRIQVKGKLASGKLIVHASATKYGYDETRVHTVYFYIDDGRTGGHLDATRRDSRIVEGGFTLDDGPYKKEFDLNSIPVAFGASGSANLRVLTILNDNQPHWVGAFVATGIFGSLDLLQISYTCVPDTECSIELVN